MRYGLRLLGFALVAAAIPGIAMTHARRGPTSQHLLGKKSARASKPASQRSIDDGRAAEIQAALSNAGYLSGETSGHWDSATEAAMQRFQSDNGWQTKLIPDSRAIIKLGLGGPNSSNTGSMADRSSIPSAGATENSLLSRR